MEWTGGTHTFVRFDVRGADCYLAVDTVREVILAPPITRIFRGPPFVHGVVNIRGEVIPVLDPGMLLGIDAQGSPGAPQLVVLEVDEFLVALTSGGDVGVCRRTGDEIAQPPVDLSIDATDCVTGILPPAGTGKGPGLILDGHRILSLPAVAALRSGAEQA